MPLTCMQLKYTFNDRMQCKLLTAIIRSYLLNILHASATNITKQCNTSKFRNSTNG